MEGITIAIDCREHDLIDKFADQLPEKQVKSLVIGDIHIETPELMVILERKTVKDLAASVKDGRYKEQKLRLLSFDAESKQKQIIYIIEGYYTFSDDFKVSNISGEILNSCVINTIMRDKIYVVFTKNIHETADFVKGIYKRIKKDPLKYITTTNGSHESKHVSSQEYTESIVKSRKKDNVDKQTCFLSQLSMIPGISSKKAKVIIDSLNLTCMKDLCMLFSDSDEKDIAMLKKVNGIGPNLAATIVKYLK